VSSPQPITATGPTSTAIKKTTVLNSRAAAEDITDLQSHVSVETPSLGFPGTLGFCKYRAARRSEKQLNWGVAG
jgi:hypothetical protein